MKLSISMASTDRPIRTQSVSHRAVPSPSLPHRTQSQQQSRERPSSSTHQGSLSNVARKDYEQSNLAGPTSSIRSNSRDHCAPSTPSGRTDSARTGHRSHPKSGTYGRYAENSPAKSIGDGTVRHTPGSSNSARRRTTIGASTGQWALGKTIGAGSMGKVKIAKSLETGEQVRVLLLFEM